MKTQQLKVVTHVVTLGLAVMLIAFTSIAASGQSEISLYSFTGGSDGDQPFAGLVSDGAGNVYGTTNGGGVFGAGTVFKLAPISGGGWTHTVLYSFSGGTDGGYPYASLIFDAAGNLYGTTYDGGAASCSQFAYGCGVVFELSPRPSGKWREKVLYRFQKNGRDGLYPYAGLTLDASGNLYGTTVQGGSYNQGTVFKLTLSNNRWKEQVLHTFSGGGDGGQPLGSLTFDTAGNLYGTTSGGGTGNKGVVFELVRGSNGRWKERVLHRFSGPDGLSPYAGVIFDASGNLYGTTPYGGTGQGCYGTSCGNVFELIPQSGGGWAATTLYSFSGNVDGAYPNGGVNFDAAGNLYGTTVNGGTTPFPAGFGAVYKLTNSGGSWSQAVLYTFGGGADGCFSYATLISDAAGNLYGTTRSGNGQCLAGSTGGVVFQIVP